MADPNAVGGREIHTVRFPAGAPPEQVDVLVVGAGPVGLAAAVELAGRGVDVAVIDRARTATLVRAGAMGHTPRVVEHFRRWGVLQAIRDGWTVPPEWNRGIRVVTSLTGHELIPTPPPSFTGHGRSRHSTEEAIRRPQTVLQQAFLDHLGRREVPVVGGWEVEALDDGSEEAGPVGVGVIDVSSAERRTVRAAYVVGADGGRSTVRRLAGIGREGAYAAEKRLRLVVRTGDARPVLGPSPSATNIVVNAKASGFLAAVSTREWRVYAGPYPLDHDPTEEDLLGVARAAFGADLDLELVSVTTFHHATRIATSFRQRRVLLAGDAAHVRTPGGNLGEGLGDVVNLGWKLAAVLRGDAPDRLLDSYEEERHPHNLRVAEHALERGRRTEATLAEIRRDGIPDDADLSVPADERRAQIGARLRRDPVASPGVVFDERYDCSSAIWYDPGQLDEEQPWDPARYLDDARPGHRAPDGIVDPYGDTLHDRVGWPFALLVLTADAATEAAFVTEAAVRSLPLAVVHLTDPDARAVYGTGHVLVRPDQHVAWRGAVLPAGGAAAVLDRVLGVTAARGADHPPLELAGVRHA